MENKEKTFLVRLEKDLHEKYKNLCKQKKSNSFSLDIVCVAKIYPFNS